MHKKKKKTCISKDAGHDPHASLFFGQVLRRVDGTVVRKDGQCDVMTRRNMCVIGSTHDAMLWTKMVTHETLHGGISLSENIGRTHCALLWTEMI